MDTLELSAREKEAIEKENKKEARKARESKKLKIAVDKSYEEKGIFPQKVPTLSETLMEDSDDEMEIDMLEESDDDFEKAPEYNTLRIKNFAR